MLSLHDNVQHLIFSQVEAKSTNRRDLGSAPIA